MPRRKNDRAIEGKIAIPRRYVELLERVCVRPLLYDEDYGWGFEFDDDCPLHGRNSKHDQNEDEDHG